MTKVGAVLVGILVASASALATWLALEAATGERLVWAVPGVIPFLFFMTAGIAVLLGLPSVLLLERLGRFNFTWVLLAGVVAGVLPWLAVELSSRHGISHDALPILLHFALCGAAGGASYYLVFRLMHRGPRVRRQLR